MATIKFVLSLVVLIVLVVQNGVAQTCSSSLGGLNVCAPFVVPGAASTPSSGCCGALRAVNHDCLCSTLRIAARIPAQCNLPPLHCGN